MLVELVTHCFSGDNTREWPGLWRYWRMLCYQLSSIVLDPPWDVKLQVSVYYCPEDYKTVSVLNFFKQFTPVNTTWNWQPQTRERLMSRATGRNHACQNTQADMIWFTDCDYVFACHAFEGLKDFENFEPLVYPRHVNIHRSHEIGEQYLKEVLSPCLVTINDNDFYDHTAKKAIGGIQIAKGDYCREHGYIPRSWKAHGRDNSFRDRMYCGTTDLRFVKTVRRKHYSDDPQKYPPKYTIRPERKNWTGTGIDLRGVYRLRHLKD